MAEGRQPSQAQREFAERLFREHGSRLRSIARRNSLNADDAEEALQRTLIIAMDTDSDMPGSPVAWATTVVKREAWRIRRQRTHRVHRPAGDERPTDQIERLPAEDAGPQEALERAERVKAFRRAFDSLKPQEREVLLLIGAGFSYEEIQRQTGFSYTKVNRCSAEGRATLRQRMAAWERDGNEALSDLHNPHALRKEPTATLLRRRKDLLDARRIQARAEEDATQLRELALQRRRHRFERAKAERLALESNPQVSRAGIVRARAVERSARESLTRLGPTRTIAAIDEELARRREPILRDAVRNQPPYVVSALGPPPSGHAERIRWCAAVDRLVALRQVKGISDPQRPLGEHPSAETLSRLARIRRVITREQDGPADAPPAPELGL